MADAPFVIRDPHVAQFGTDQLPAAWDVHYLTPRCTIPCRNKRDLEGAPLNTRDPGKVTCPECKDKMT